MNPPLCPPDFQISSYDYSLPENFIAQSPVENRDDSRLLVLYKKTGEIYHKMFSDILDYILPSDLLILNDTKVRPARIEGEKYPSGGKVSALLLKERNQEHTWEALVGGKVRPNQVIRFKEGLEAIVLEKLPGGKTILSFTSNPTSEEILNRIGLPPLPPYIRRPPRPEDRFQYQTVFAKNPGSLAAPTAGLHFTTALLEKARQKGVKIKFITLHIGTGTFLPVRTEDIREHKMEPEEYEIPVDTLKQLRQTKDKKNRVFAVGTTSTRVLESLPHIVPSDKMFTGRTNLFIYPGFDFKHVDALLTNFHIPRSTLLMLVSAFAGRHNIKRAYLEAIDRQYRFLSFGDAMLIL